MNTVGNIFSGQVVGETAKTLSERFGKVLQKRQSMSITRSDKTTSISTQMDSLIPQSKISTPKMLERASANSSTPIFPLLIQSQVSRA